MSAEPGVGAVEGAPDAPATVYDFDAVLEAAGPTGRNVKVTLPRHPREVFGRARVPVVVRIDDHPPFRTTVAVYDGAGLVGLRQDQMAATGVAAGQRVHVRLEMEEGPRRVDVPAELAAALAAAPDAAATYDGLAYSHRREYARWVDGAKRQPTRDARAARAVEMLRAGTRSPG